MIIRDLVPVFFSRRSNATCDRANILIQQHPFWNVDMACLLSPMYTSMCSPIYVIHVLLFRDANTSLVYTGWRQYQKLSQFPPQTAHLQT